MYFLNMTLPPRVWAYGGEKTMAQLKVGEKEGNSIADKLTERLEKFGSADMQRKVEEYRYNKIIDQRADMMSKAIDIIDKMEYDYRKMERTPDNVIRQEGYTEKKFEEMKKLREKIEKAHKAFDKALNGKEQKDFDDVKQLVSNQPKGEDKSGKPEGEGGEKSS